MSIVTTCMDSQMSTSDSLWNDRNVIHLIQDFRDMLCLTMGEAFDVLRCSYVLAQPLEVGRVSARARVFRIGPGSAAVHELSRICECLELLDLLSDFTLTLHRRLQSRWRRDRPSTTCKPVRSRASRRQKTSSNSFTHRKLLLLLPNRRTMV